LNAKATGSPWSRWPDARDSATGYFLSNLEDHWALVQVAVVDDLEEDIGGVRAIAEMADLVDDQHMGWA
jgi:hypothetical protein